MRVYADGECVSMPGKEAAEKGKRMHEDLLERPFVHLVGDGLEDVTGANEGNKKTSERPKGGEGCESASKGLTEPPLLLNHSCRRIPLLPVTLEARPVLFDLLKIVAPPSNGDSFFMKTPRLNEDEPPLID
jgi:hypothetical protein